MFRALAIATSIEKTVASVPGAGALHEIGERPVGEELAGRIADVAPHFLQHAVAFAVVVLVDCRGIGAFDRAEDVGEVLPLPLAARRRGLLHTGALVDTLGDLLNLG